MTQQHRVYEFIEAFRARLAKGAKTYGDQSFSADPDSLLAELEEETLDIAGWGFILWARLRQMRAVLFETLGDRAIMDEQEFLADVGEETPPIARKRPAKPSEPPRVAQETPAHPQAQERPPSAPREPTPTPDQVIEQLLKALERIPMAPVMGATIDPENPVAPEKGDDTTLSGFRPEHPVARIKANVERWRRQWKAGAVQNPPSNEPARAPYDPTAELGFNCSACNQHFSYESLSETGAAGQDLCMSCAEEKTP